MAGRFFFVLAFACRQSAVTLLVLPFLSLFDRRQFKASLALILVGLLSCAFISLSLEPSFAQLNLTHKMHEQFQWSVFFRSVCAFSLFAWAGAGVRHLLDGGFTAERRSLGLAGVMALVSGLVLQPWQGWIGLDVTYLGAIPGVQLLIWSGLIFFAGFAPTHLASLRLNFALLASAMVVLTSLRGAVWDYYAVEIALIGALSVKSMPSKEASPPRWLWGGVALYALVCLVYAASLWRFHDVIALRTRLYEEAQRRGDITIHEVSRAPFGYTGWKLFDSCRFAHKNSEYIAPILTLA